MYRQNLKLVSLVEPVISALGYEMLGVELHSMGHRKLLRIYIDSMNGISVDDCARVSNQLNGVLDVEDPVRGSYDLEVSSPGLDRPLFTLDHFRRFAGHRVQVQLYEKLDGRRRYQGEIGEVNENQIIIIDGDAKYSIPVDLIERARLVARFG